MVDSVTGNRNLVLPEVGQDSGIWGGILNSGVMSQLDLILGATTAVAITSGDVTLSISQWNNCAIQLTGALTGNHNLILPFNANSGSVAVGGLFVIENNTTGAFNVTVITQASGSTGVVVPQGVRTWLYSDTTNVWYADDAAVHIIPFSGNPNGFVAGTAGSVNNPPSLVWDYTNGILYFCITTGTTTTAVWAASSAVVSGFNTASNLQLSASVTSNILTVTALAANTGLPASAGNPITIPFRSATLTNGAPVNRAITSALAIDTNTIGASLGSLSSNVAFRFWVAALDDTTGGSAQVQLALINCSTVNGVQCPDEASLVSSTPMSSGATSAYTFYTENGITVTNKPWRILGYIEYGVGLTTAGTYNTAPTIVQLFGPGIRKPGETSQTVYANSTTQATTTSSVFAALTSGLSASITPSSKVNGVRVTINGSLDRGSINDTVSLQAARASTLIGVPITVSSPGVGGGGGFVSSASLFAVDFPNTTSSTAYSYQGKTSANTLSYPASSTGVTIELQEIMG